MSSPSQRRRLWFLVPDRTGTAVLVDGTGDLPQASADLAEGETTATVAARLAHRRWGVRVPVVELLFDVGAGTEGDAGVAALVRLEPPPPLWEPPGGTRWAPLAGPDPTAPGALGSRVATLLAELRHEREPDPRRSRWSLPGWHERAVAWIDRTLLAAGWGPATSVEQVRHWGISAVMRVTAGHRTAWFKAVFPGFHREPAITAHLHRAMPGTVAPVLGTEEHEGWLLLADVGSTFLSADLGRSPTAIHTLVTVQRAFLGRSEELVAAGCPHRPLHDLAPALDAALRDPEVRAWAPVEADRVAALAAWVQESAEVIGRLGIPDTLVHGDFHPGNVALVDGTAVLIDWSDAAVSHPLVDVLTWVDWTQDDPALTEEVWEAFLAAWAGTIDAEAFRPHRARFAGLAAAYHTVSYAGIVTGVEPSLSYEHADGLTGFLGLLEAAADRV